MNSKIEQIHALHNLFVQSAITQGEYNFLKSEIIGQESYVKNESEKEIDIIIPDSNFQLFLSEKLNIQVVNNTVKYDDIKDITYVKCDFANINNLSGIEHFTALEYLDCAFNQIDYLDISKNKNLRELHIVRNQIDEIDLTNNPLLRLFSANHNALYHLDLSKNLNLKFLFCSNNYLESIIFGENSLEMIHLEGNPGDWWQKFQISK